MESADIAVLLTVVGSIICFGGAAVLALGWAFRNGQFDNFQRGALSIFDADEPVGEPTDFFPDYRGRTPDQDQPHHWTRET